LAEGDLPTGETGNLLHVNRSEFVTLWPGDKQQIVVEKPDQTSELVDKTKTISAREIPTDPIEVLQAIAKIGIATREDAALVMAMVSNAILGEIDPVLINDLLQESYPPSSHRRTVIEPIPSTMPAKVTFAQASSMVASPEAPQATAEQATMNPIELKKNRIIGRFFQLINFLPGKVIRTVTYNGKSLQLALEYFPHKQTGLLTVGKDTARLDTSLSWKIDRHYLLPASNQNHLYPQYRLDFGFDHIFDFLCTVLDKA
jgi:hypothetical protein